MVIQRLTHWYKRDKSSADKHKHRKLNYRFMINLFQLPAIQPFSESNFTFNLLVSKQICTWMKQIHTSISTQWMISMKHNEIDKSQILKFEEIDEPVNWFEHNNSKIKLRSRTLRSLYLQSNNLEIVAYQDCCMLDESIWFKPNLWPWVVLCEIEPDEQGLGLEPRNCGWTCVWNCWKSNNRGCLKNWNLLLIYSFCCVCAAGWIRTREHRVCDWNWFWYTDGRNPDWQLLRVNNIDLVCFESNKLPLLWYQLLVPISSNNDQMFAIYWMIDEITYKNEEQSLKLSL